jgi:hypothetical protein
MFERIVKVGKPDALKKYASTFAGKLETDTATIEEARLLSHLLSVESPNFRNGLALPKPDFIANGGGVGETYFDVAEMLADGFPIDKPIHLHLRYDMGGKIRMIEVHDAAYQVAVHGRAGYRGIFTDLDRA